MPGRESEKPRQQDEGQGWKESIEAWRKAAEMHRLSMEAYTDMAEIMSRHLGEMAKGYRDADRPGTGRELHRDAAHTNSEIMKEAMRTPSVLRLFAANLDAFLDWRMGLEDAQEGQGMMGLATRREMSQVQKTLYDLRKEVERLSKATATGDVQDDQGK